MLLRLFQLFWNKQHGVPNVLKRTFLQTHCFFHCKHIVARVRSPRPNLSRCRAYVWFRAPVRPSQKRMRTQGHCRWKPRIRHRAHSRTGEISCLSATPPARSWSCFFCLWCACNAQLPGNGCLVSQRTSPQPRFASINKMTHLTAAADRH